MASLSQYRSTRGRTPVSYQEDIIRAQTPRLIGMRERELEREYNERRLAMAERDQNLRAKEIDQATTVQGLGTLVQGAGLLETVRPGTIRGIGESLGIVRPSLTPSAGGVSGVGVSPGIPGSSGTATAAGVGPITPGLASAFSAGTAPVGGSISAFPGTAGLVGPSGLPLSASVAAPAASGAATAAGLGSTSAPAAVSGAIGPTVGSTIGSTTGTASGTGAATAGAATAGVTSYLGPVGAGFAGGQIGSKLIGPLLPFGGKREKAIIGGGLGGAGAGALAGSIIPGVGTAIGAVVGGVVGAIGGASVIATATYGIDSPETQLAQAFRRRFVGQLEYRGYRIFGDPIAQLISRNPQMKEIIRTRLVDPILIAMKAELDGVPSEEYQLERQYLKRWREYCLVLGKASYRASVHHQKKRDIEQYFAMTQPLVG